MRKLNTHVLFMIGAAASFAVMGGFVKMLHHLPTFEVAFFRTFINMVAFLPWALSNPKLVARWRQEPKALLTRGVCGGLSIILYFYAIQHLRLADAVMLNQAAPILVLVFSAIFLGERLTRISVISILVAFLGIALIIKPIFDIRTREHLLAATAGLGSTIVAAIAYVSIKVATRSIPSRVIVFTFAVVACALTAIPTLIVYQAPSSMEWLLLFGAGVFATLAQELMTRGYVGLPASLGSSLLLLTVAFSALLGWAVWGEVPDLVSFAGMGLTVAGLLTAFRFKPKLS